MSTTTPAVRAAGIEQREEPSSGLGATDPRLPLYQRLKDDFLAKLASRAWRPGAAIPTEVELCRAYGVSLGTVRRAVELLVADGLLERTQGRGTFVQRPSFEGSLFRFFRYHVDGEDRRVPRGRILSRAIRTPPPEVGNALRLRPREKAIVLTRLRLFDDQPFVHEEIWLSLARFAALARISLSDFDNLLYPLYERHCGQTIASAREYLSIAKAQGAIAERLGVEAGAPIVVIDRIASGYDKTPLEWRRSHGVADCFRYHVEIR